MKHSRRWRYSLLLASLTMQAPLGFAQPLEVDRRTLEDTRSMIDRLADSPLKHEMEQQFSMFERDLQNGRTDDAITQEVETERSAKEALLNELPKEAAEQTRAVIEHNAVSESEGGANPETVANVEKAIEESAKSHPELETSLREIGDTVKETAEKSSPEAKEEIEPRREVERVSDTGESAVASPEVEQSSTAERTAENTLSTTAEQNATTETFLKNDPTTGDPIYQHADGTCHDHTTDATVPCE